MLDMLNYPNNLNFLQVYEYILKSKYHPSINTVKLVYRLEAQEDPTNFFR